MLNHSELFITITLHGEGASDVATLAYPGIIPQEFRSVHMSKLMIKGGHIAIAISYVRVSRITMIHTNLGAAMALEHDRHNYVLEQ